MKVLIVGSGGREHALAWKIAQSPSVDQVLAAPGNAGIARVADRRPVAADDLDGLLTLARDEAVDFVVVGPEQPLVAGLVDRLDAAGIASFEAERGGRPPGRLESLHQGLCRRHAAIPTASYASFTEAAAARAYVRAQGAPLVVKADGLAAGKGVIMAETEDQALAAIDAMMAEGAFGAAGATVVIEEWMRGEEASFFALSDGQNILPLASAQDHKRVGDGDTGPNTGGMGAYSPAPVVDAAMERRILETIIAPTVAGMAAEGAPFKGVLYAGLMITAEGPKLIEYNCRFGDPECQVLMARLESDPLPALRACHGGGLDQVALTWRDDPALMVVLAADGYPGAYAKDTIIDIPGDLETADPPIFHAGTRRDDQGRLRAAGGRVLGVTGLGATIAVAAQAAAYAAVDRITPPEDLSARHRLARR